MNNDELAKMVEMAKERAEWQSVSDVIYVPYVDEVGVACAHTSAIVKRLSERDFIASAPAVIVALAEQLEQMKANWNAQAVVADGYWQELEALKAKKEEWQNPHDVLPPMTDGYRSDVVIMACEGQYHHKKDKWLINPQPFGWRVQDD